jgi:SAM-dependent methyltransferase
MKAPDLVGRGSCPLCGSGEHVPHIEFPDIPVVRCKSCGFLFSGRVMSTSGMNQYYRSNFDSERHRQGQYINARINAWAIQILLPIKSWKSLLDVGTGYGYLLHQMAALEGVSAIGVELSEKEASYGINHLGVDIRNTALSSAGLIKGSFDLVSCFEVVEHIQDPASFLEELLAYVRPGGFLLVMTDNFESKVARELGPSFPKWIPHCHISHFGPITLEALFSSLKGIEVTGRLSYTPWELLARSFYVRMLGRHSSAKEGFSLAGALNSEMEGTYRFFVLRRLINFRWARLSATKNLGGALMYLVGRKAM